MSQAINQYVSREAWQIDAIKCFLNKLENGKAAFIARANLKNRNEIISLYTSPDDVSQWLSGWGANNEMAERPES